MSVTPLIIRGIDRRNVAQCIVLGPTIDAASAVESRFDRGWRRLTATRDDRTVGEIAVKRGKRTWWAES